MFLYEQSINGAHILHYIRLNLYVKCLKCFRSLRVKFSSKQIDLEFLRPWRFKLCYCVFDPMVDVCLISKESADSIFRLGAEDKSNKFSGKIGTYLHKHTASNQDKTLIITFGCSLVLEPGDFSVPQAFLGTLNITSLHVSK